MLNKNTEEYRYKIACAMPEAELLQNIKTLANYLGWTGIYHTWRSDHSEAGYPDLTMFHPEQKRIIWVECKTSRRALAPAQVKFHALIAECGGEVYVWRPEDWLSGEIERKLK